ncbi:type I restriction endonuclease subunit S [Photobacterium kishitanii]|uniref:restriction endonuclease subunit S n=1 Tax=Photobacterium kishitanii TaxID=318456 RepID=UPI0007F0264F|nr:restriction endonuclease subunit S [Photobacterium kishitanii]OBU27970.1 type I restriction endonuclease subunit S [Photobacterium kishitanii]PSW66563.1 type I restriction endonuclease subunit S [Photobacterium kishitanii]
MTVESLITQHIDTWTSAVKPKSTSGRGSRKKLELYGVKKLRELILELAVRGKLVPQDPNDEPASVLLERIAKEKAQLVKEKKIKKQKELPAISDDELPYSIPKNWVWCRLDDICFGITSGSTPPKSNFDESEGIPYLKVYNIRDQKVDFDYKPQFVDLECHATKLKRSSLYPGDVIMNIVGPPLGKVAIISNDYPEWNCNQAITFFRPIEPSLNTYIYTYLRAGTFLRTIDLIGTAGQDNISVTKSRSILLPTPPLEEQHRIVAKVDELMALCDQLEQQTEASIEAHQLLVSTLLNTLTHSVDADELMENWARISDHFDTLFTTEESIDQLKQTILQLAVMGKLVPQDPNDEPASVLLERIAEEKTQLIKEKKIKKQKALPPIADDEKLFDLPNGWEWCKFGELSQFINGDRGKNYPNKNEYVSDGVPWINTGHIQSDGTLTTSDMNFITEEKFDSLRSGKVIPDDLVYCLRGATFGKTAFVKPYLHGAIASSLMIIRLYDKRMNGFVYKYLISAFGRSQIFRFDNGSAQPNLSANSVGLYAFPCPPLEEQKRIILKVDELFSVCDALKGNIKSSQTTQLHLTDTIVEQAV